MDMDLQHAQPSSYRQLCNYHRETRSIGFMSGSGPEVLSGESLIELVDRGCPVAHIAKIPARPGVVGLPQHPVDPELLARLGVGHLWSCLLYTSDAADDYFWV